MTVATGLFIVSERLCEGLREEGCVTGLFARIRLNFPLQNRQISDECAITSCAVHVLQSGWAGCKSFQAFLTAESDSRGARLFKRLCLPEVRSCRWGF